MYVDFDPYSITANESRVRFRQLTEIAAIHGHQIPLFLNYQTVEMEMRDGSKIEARLHIPKKMVANKMGVLIRFHGGGWVIGGPEDKYMWTVFDLKSTNFAILDVDYRLAPEFRHPKQNEDCVDSLKWVIKNSDKFNFNTSKIALFGESAGGHLASYVSLSNADSNSPIQIGLQILIVPSVGWIHNDDWVEKYSTLALTLRRTKFYFHQWTNSLNETFWENEPTIASLKYNPKTNPTQFWKRIPQTLILIAECDILSGQARKFHEKLLSNGVNSEIIEFPNHMHSTFVFQIEPYKQEILKATNQFFNSI